MPTSGELALDDSFARELPELHVEWQPTSVPAPTLVALNEELAEELGLDAAFLASPDGIAILVGNAVSADSAPTAMAYAGHQFGSFSGRLGDGRALLIGEVSDREGNRRDVHLKGSGRTPFARGGDGKAALGPMLREFLMAEALHALGVSTGRALSVVATGEQLHREGLVPGAVLARVAASHIRVGTFEYAARLGDDDVLQRLADYSIERHHPAAADAGDGRYLALLEAVTETQASLVAEWMLVGFIHGVMNTDNVTISGETIDYGPCAFMDRHDPATVFSSIDHGGRYAYGNQPGITQWNLTRLAETLLPVIDDDPDTAVAAATEVLTSFPDRYQRRWLAGMRRKLGLGETVRGDEALAGDLLGLLHSQRVDHTAAFRALASDVRGDGRQLEELFETRSALDEWLEQWRSRLAGQGRDLASVAAEMDLVNPIYIPRNHLVEEALDAAVAGDAAPFHRLLEVVTSPFEDRVGLDRFASPAAGSFNDSFQTFCGT
jgi:uncharacterized protein YdiU (UPF0061 family)